MSKNPKVVLIKLKNLDELCVKSKRLQNFNKICDKSSSSQSSSLIKPLKRTTKRILSESENDEIISIPSSVGESPKKKVLLEVVPPSSSKKKPISSRKKNKKILDGSNCKKITDFFKSGKKSSETTQQQQSQKSVRRNLENKLSEVCQKNRLIPSSISSRSPEVELECNTFEVPPPIQRHVSPILRKPAKPNKKVPPPYKILEGCFAVDAFSFGDIDGVTHYFLTHFHADHYIGLKKSFQFPIYMTQITANLVIQFIKVDPKYIRVINFYETYVIGDTTSTVVAMDANHCPGAAMLLFNINGKNILHTGDFRGCPSMEEEPLFWNLDIDTIYLDTTYLTSKSDHAPQSLSIQIGIETIKKYKSQHIGEKILIICGSYLIGKEKMWVKIAETFNIKVWAEPRRRQALKCLNNIEINQRLVDNQQDADLHILSMGKNLMYENIVKYMDQLQDSFTHAIVIKPSGWEAHSKARNQGNISIVGVEYSEHSSFQELKRFVRFLRPKNVISTVPIGRGVVNTPCVPEKWYLGETKPKTKRGQQSITNFIAVTPVVPVIPVVPDIPVAEEELLMDLTLFSDDKSDWMS